MAREPQRLKPSTARRAYDANHQTPWRCRNVTHVLGGPPLNTRRDREDEMLERENDRMRENLLALPAFDRTLITVIVTSNVGVLILRLHETLCAGDTEVWSSPCGETDSLRNPTDAARDILFNDLGVHVDSLTIRHHATLVVRRNTHHMLHHIYRWQMPEPHLNIRIGPDATMWTWCASRNTLPQTFAVQYERGFVLQFVH